MHWSNFWHSGGMWVFWLVILLAIGWIIHLTVRSMGRSEPPHDSPRQILDRRYASGEIDREEYQRAIEDLRQF